ncbi:hypothetical protein [Parashewanella tropica]|uniref:hypothetical protein n=1 Tax=Parashewanella tropica TaxID=2547970 RepID=UPI0010594786|nr:hypothetical protein [Parashewanella tropica]
MNRRVWPFLVHSVSEIGGTIAFVLAFGWLIFPNAQDLAHWQMSIEQWTFTLESSQLFGLSPWILLSLVTLALAVVLFELSGLKFWQSMIIVSIGLTLLILGYGYSPIGLGFVLLILVGIALCRISA